MATKPCRECSHLVGRDAKTCPSCGAPDPWQGEATYNLGKILYNIDQVTTNALKLVCALIAIVFCFVIIPSDK